MKNKVRCGLGSQWSGEERHHSVYWWVIFPELDSESPAMSRKTYLTAKGALKGVKTFLDKYGLAGWPSKADIREMERYTGER